MTDAQSAQKVTDALKNKGGVISATCVQKEEVCRVEIDPSKVKKADVVLAVSKLGFKASDKEI